MEFSNAGAERLASQLHRRRLVERGERGVESMKDTKLVYFIEQRMGMDDRWIGIAGPINEITADELITEMCNANPGVTFRKVEAEILED
jgi:hypothetical protein